MEKYQNAIILSFIIALATYNSMMCNDKTDICNCQIL